MTMAKPFIFLETAAPDAENRRSFLFNDFKVTLVFRAGDDPVDFFQKAESFLKKGYWLAGYFSYEFGYWLDEALAPLRRAGDFPLAWLAVCKRPDDQPAKPLRGVPPWRETRRPETDTGYQIKNITQNISQKQYAKDIHTIKKYLGLGRTYQVNHTFKLKFDFQGDPAGFYRSLKSRQPTPYSAVIFDGRRHILSFSPELFFRRAGQKIIARPMKGTLSLNGGRARFINDPKTRAENIMIVDLLRNDLGRICRKGMVKATKLFALEKYPTLYQMTSTISGRLKKSIGWQEIFVSLFPCGSVTGAPKIETMRIIAELEKEPRGIYCGAIGYISPQGDACFNVAIRTAVINKGKGELGVGGGIVYDSQAPKEFKEALLKAEFLTRPIPQFSLTETMLWEKDKGIYLGNLHFDRLVRSSDHFSIPLNMKVLLKALQKKVRKLNRDSKIRILVDQQGLFTITVGRLDRHKPPFKIKISPKRLDPQNPFLYHKTTLRGLYDQGLKTARSQGFYEVIFLNKQGQVCEGSFTNIFIQQRGKLYTPPVLCGLLPGVLRQQLLKTGKAQEKTLYLKDLRRADKVFVGNSVRGLLEVEERGRL